MRTLFVFKEYCSLLSFFVWIKEKLWPVFIVLRIKEKRRLGIKWEYTLDIFVRKKVKTRYRSFIKTSFLFMNPRK